MPNQPKTPARTVRIDDELWDAARVEAKKKGASVSDVIRTALRKHLGLLLVALVLAGCAGNAQAANVTHKPAPVAVAADWNGTQGLTAKDVHLPAPNGRPAPKSGTWPCALPMSVTVAVAPGVDEVKVWRELDYPIATMQALGYTVAVKGESAYATNYEAPTTRGSVVIVVAANPKDQPDLTDNLGVAQAMTATAGSGSTYESAAIVVNAKTGLAGDVILHEWGHVVGLEHKDGTVMQAIGRAPVTFDSSEVAAVACP